MRPLVRSLLGGRRCPWALQWAQTQLASWPGRKSGKGEAEGSAHLQHGPHWRWGLKASNLPSCCWPDSTDGACPHDPLQSGSRSSCSAESRRCQPCRTPSPLAPWLTGCYGLIWGQTSVHTSQKTRQQVRLGRILVKTSYSLEDSLDIRDKCCCLKTPNLSFPFSDVSHLILIDRKSPCKFLPCSILTHLYLLMFLEPHNPGSSFLPHLTPLFFLSSHHLPLPSFFSPCHLPFISHPSPP